MRIKSRHVAVVVMLILFGGIALSTALGYWQTVSTKIPQKYNEGEFAGEYNPEDIRGSYAFSDIAEAFEIPIEELAKAFGLDKAGIDPAPFKVKDLGTLFPLEGSSEGAIETSSVRLFVALYKGLPYELTGEESKMPRPAVEMLLAKANLSEEQKNYLEEHLIELSTQTVSPVQPSTKEGTAGTGEENERFVRGTTTFRNVLDWGVPEAAIEEIIGAKLPNPVMSIRDYCTQNGLSFSTIKGVLQEKVDELS